MKLNGERIARTAIQTGAGAGVTFITAIMTDFSLPVAVMALIQFVGSVVTAVLMNIKKQTEEMDNENND